MVPDLQWFEKQIQKIFVEIIKIIKDENKSRVIVEFLTRSQNVFTEFGYQMAIQEGLELLHTFRSCVSDFTEKRNAETQLDKSDWKAETIAFDLAIYDLCGLCLISMVLGLSRSFEKLNAKSLTDSISSIKWNKNKSVYNISFPREVIKQIEFINKGLHFEYKVEGNFISPIWYRQQLVAISLIQCIKTKIELLMQELEIAFEQEANRLIKQKFYASAVQVIDRGLEACEKYRYHFATLQENINGFQSLRRVDDIPWPQIEWKEINEKCLSIREKIVITYSEMLPYLTTLPESKELPDFFGHGYTVIANECYGAMASGNERLFCAVISTAICCISLSSTAT